MVKGMVAAVVAVVAVAAAHGAAAAVTQVDGAGYADLVPVSPGVYGVEAISGERDSWKLGVGTQTGRDGAFASSNKIDWNKGTYEFEISWQKDKVKAKIGEAEVEYKTSWKFGDAIRVSTLGGASVDINEVDGTKFDLSAADGKSLYFADLKGFGDGWSMKGTIAMAAGKGATDYLQVTMGTIGEAPVPAALLLFGTGIAGLGAFARRTRKG